MHLGAWPHRQMQLNVDSLWANVQSLKIIPGWESRNAFVKIYRNSKEVVFASLNRQVRIANLQVHRRSDINFSRYLQVSFAILVGFGKLHKVLWGCSAIY